MKTPPKVTDMIVKTGNPAALDKILQQFGAVLVQDDPNAGTYLHHDGGYVARCFGDADFIKFVLHNQGYGQVVKQLDTLV